MNFMRSISSTFLCICRYCSPTAFREHVARIMNVAAMWIIPLPFIFGVSFSLKQQPRLEQASLCFGILFDAFSFVFFLFEISEKRVRAKRELLKNDKLVVSLPQYVTVSSIAHPKKVNRKFFFRLFSESASSIYHLNWGIECGSHKQVRMLFDFVC